MHPPSTPIRLQAAVFCNNCNVLLHAAMSKAGLEDDCDACGERGKAGSLVSARAHCRLCASTALVSPPLACLSLCRRHAPSFHLNPSANPSSTRSPQPLSAPQTTPRRAPRACRRRRWRRCRCRERWTSFAVRAACGQARGALVAVVEPLGVGCRCRARWGASAVRGQCWLGQGEGLPAAVWEGTAAVWDG